MKRTLLSILLLFIPLAAAAENVNIMLTKANGAITPSATDENTKAIKNKEGIVEITEDVTVNIQCVGFTCEKTAIFLGKSSQFTPERTTKSVGGKTVHVLTAKINAISISTEGSLLRILDDDKEIFTATLKKKKGDDRESDDAGGDDDEVIEFADRCSGIHIADVGSTISNPQFVVTPGGSVQDRTTQPIDEDDVVSIHVLSTDQGLLQSLEVTRTSATRTTGNITLAGSGVKIPAIKRESQEDLPPCFYRTYEVSDLAPGEVTVDIAARVQAKRTSLGTLKFNVNRLYDGIISFGPAWTNLTDRAYGLTPQGTDQIIIETEDGSSDVLYAAAYTYFWRGKRDLEKEKPKEITQRLNPTIGFTLNDPGKHALAGISYDGGHFVFTIGLHGARVTRLAPDSGAKVGEKFVGTTIPTQKKWQTGFFFAVTVDARAARALLDTILPGT